MMRARVRDAHPLRSLALYCQGGCRRRRYRNHRMIVGVWAAERDSFDVIRIVTAPDIFSGRRMAEVKLAYSNF